MPDLDRTRSRAGIEDRFRTLASHAPVGIFLTDGAGNTVFVNETWCRLTGLDPEQALGTGWIEGLHPEDREWVVAGWKKALQDGTPSEAEFRFCRPDGTTVWLHGKASQVREDEGAISGYVGILIDTTARRLDEGRLREHIERAEFIGQLSHRLSALSDPEAMVQLATEATGRRLNANRCYFAEVCDPPTRIAIHYDWHRPGEESAAGLYETRSYGSPVWWEKLARGPLLIANVDEHPATRDYAAGYHRYHTHACAAVPYSRDGKWVVTLVVSDSRPREWTPEEAQFLENVVNRFWPAIERARAASAFRQQAERLNLAVAAAELGDWSWDAATDEMTLSPRTCQIFGLPEGARVSRAHMRALLHPDDQRRAEEANRQSIANRSDYDIEYRLHHPRQGWRWIATKGRPAYGPDGRLTGMIGVLQDVTVRKEVEQRLQAREAELRLISNNAPVMLVHCDPQMRYLFANRAYASRFGLQPEQLTGRSVRDLIGPGAFAVVRPYIDRVLHGEAVEFEIAVPYERFGVRFIRASIVPDLAPDNSARGWLAAITDVTERRGAEESLRERTRTLEILNGLSSALVAEHDPDRILQAVIDAGREISAAEVARFDRRFPGAAILRHGDYAEPAPLPGLPAPGAYRSYLAVPVVSRSGEVLGGLFFGHPAPGRFTEQAERTIVGLAAEAAIAIDNANVYRTLEQRVQERTTSLRDAITQMEEFSYSVSHDLRAPLRAMNGYAQALLDDYGDRLDATARGYLDRIQRSSQRMEKLTYDLLTYSRIARSEVQTSTVNLDKLIADIVHQYVELQPPGSLVEISGPLGDARGHESSLAQAAANLLTNAVKFVPAGVTPRVRIWTEAVNQRVRLWVADNGIGVKPEHRARLFQVFERLPTGARYEGTGIGLAIVRKAMEKMGGSCGVDSDGKSGSRFWLELPKA